MRGEEFAPLVAALAARGIRTLTFDHLGVGAEAAADAGLTIAAMAAHAWRQVPAPYARLFGLSMGAMVAAAMAEAAPERVAGLILGATSPNSAALPAVPDALNDAWINLGSRADLARELAVNFSRTARAQRPELVHAYVAYRQRGGNLQPRRAFQAQLGALRAFDGPPTFALLAALACPKLVIAGAEDELFPLAHAREVARLLAAPLRELPATGHLMHLENPEGLAALLA